MLNLSSNLSVGFMEARAATTIGERDPLMKALKAASTSFPDIVTSAMLKISNISKTCSVETLEGDKTLSAVYLDAFERLAFSYRSSSNHTMASKYYDLMTNLMPNENPLKIRAHVDAAFCYEKALNRASAIDSDQDHLKTLECKVINHYQRAIALNSSAKLINEDSLNRKLDAFRHKTVG
jgi:hypothetical protein